jgi:DNA-3-methyladenine glycosylase I
VFDENDVKRLVLNAGIVRHKGKIESSINNARRAQEMRQEFGTLAKYFWRFEPDANNRPEQITYQTLGGLTTSAESIALSKDLRKRGWTFVGPTTMYAFMQAMGLVNDHIEGCSARLKASVARSEFMSSVSMSAV